MLMFAREKHEAAYLNASTEDAVIKDQAMQKKI